MTKEEIRQAAQKEFAYQFEIGSKAPLEVREGFIKGAEWMQERMIEKAENWLGNNMFNSINNGVIINGYCVSDFIERFKKAMQDESRRLD
jgi:hypothetical protein